MNIREQDERVRRAHALRRAEFARLAGVATCLAKRFVATLRGMPARPCPPRAA